MCRVHHTEHRRMILIVSLVALLLALPLASLAQPTPSAVAEIDVSLPSISAGSGNLALRLTPPSDPTRYTEGAPVVVWVAGGQDSGSLTHNLHGADDMLVISFLFPGGEDLATGRASDGVYDYRGDDCIAALRDVVLYAAGELADADGLTIDQKLDVPVLQDNIGLLGSSNGGNIAVAAAAEHGADLNGYLRYIVQWETPVSSQMATVDLGRIRLASGQQGDFINPRYHGFGPLIVPVDYGDITYSTINPAASVFLDGTGDGNYSLAPGPGGHTPDLNGDGRLSLSEDWPLGGYDGPGGKLYYSRPVAQALQDEGVFAGPWPSSIANISETMAFWDQREAVRLYDEALAAIPNLEGMVLASVRDHVQSPLNKPHIRQALEGWDHQGAWAQLNPSPIYLKRADASLIGRRDLPVNAPNRAPRDWFDNARYSVPADVATQSTLVASVWQMADRAQGQTLTVAPGAEEIVYIESEGRQIAVRIQAPDLPRYAEGAPVVVNVPGFFTSATAFDAGPAANEVGAIQIDLLWPGTEDSTSNAASDGVRDYGGPLALTALRDVVRFSLGLETDVNGYTLDQLLDSPPLYGNVGLYAFSHSGLAATNVIAQHGSEMPGLDYFVGRENPTQDATCPLETGHWDETGAAVLNPYYQYPLDYDPIRLGIDYSTVTWMTSPAFPEGKPVFLDPPGDPFIMGDQVPRFWGKRTYSVALTQALLDNGSLTPVTWPSDLSTITETMAIWPSRESVNSYPALGTQAPDLKVMLVFAADDHVQSAPDKPHIHQAYGGFRQGAGLWVRLNPDRSYALAQAEALLPGAVSDNHANSAPGNWLLSAGWAYDNSGLATHAVPLAGLAEMIDRTYADDWSANLDDVLWRYPHSYTCQLPLVMTDGEVVLTATLTLPHDVDRLRESTLIADGGRGELGAISTIWEIDLYGNVIWSYTGDLDFAHNADRLPSGNTLISDTGNDRVIEIDNDGTIVWTSEDVTLSDGSVLDYPNDANWLIDDTLLITDRDNHRALQIDRSGNVLWQFGETGVSGNDFTHLHGPHNADLLDDGHVLVADSQNNRLVEVDETGALVTYHAPGGDNALSWPRDADRLDDGNTLVVDSLNNRVLEFNTDGDVVWSYEGLDRPYDADRLPNGNTLMSSSMDGRVLEVDAAGTIIWQYPAP